MRPQRNGNRVPRHSEAGFSLIEVMSALVILAIAMTAVFATFISQQRSFTVQNRVAEMQQNLRQAVEYMSRDIRIAGYGIPDNVTIPNGVVATGVTSIRSLYAKDNTTGPDQIYVLYMFDMDSNQPPTSLTSPMGALATTISVASAGGFFDNELILVTDNTNTTADLFQISGTPAGTTISLNTGSYNVHPGFPAGGYLSSPAALVAKARFVRYYIDSTTDPAHPTLMVQRMGSPFPQPLADDIEDMQVAYGLDTSTTTPPAGIVDTWTSSPATPSQIRQVRMQFLARTRLPEAGWSETRPALGNNNGPFTADGYRRRTYDIVLDVRNSGV
jgi:prepilin-type N-terminal cleavage/methylation domain-containing protein